MVLSSFWISCIIYFDKPPFIILGIIYNLGKINAFGVIRFADNFSAVQFSIKNRPTKVQDERIIGISF